MTRALKRLVQATRYWSVCQRRFWWEVRPGYCMCCGAWCWLTNETPAYSQYDGAFICEPCADDNDHETDLAWKDYYAGRL